VVLISPSPHPPLHYCPVCVLSEAPDEPDKARRKLTFRRLLLNKCQEEFEKGDVAMAAVAAREKKNEEGGEEEDKVGCWVGGGLCVWGRGCRMLVGEPGHSHALGVAVCVGGVGGVTRMHACIALPSFNSIHTQLMHLT
jgi:hypothetical protein